MKQLWLSYNNIDNLGGLNNCVVLETLYLAHNKIKDWNEIDKLTELKKLSTLVLLGNEIYGANKVQPDRRQITYLSRS